MNSRRVQSCLEESSCVYICAYTHIPNHYDTTPVKIQILRDLRAQKRNMHWSGSVAAVQWFRQWRSGYPIRLAGAVLTQGPKLMEVLPFCRCFIWIMWLLRLLWWVKGMTAELSMSSSWKCHASLLFMLLVRTSYIAREAGK